MSYVYNYIQYVLCIYIQYVLCICIVLIKMNASHPLALRYICHSCPVVAQLVSNVQRSKKNTRDQSIDVSVTNNSPLQEKNTLVLISNVLFWFLWDFEACCRLVTSSGLGTRNQ